MEEFLNRYGKTFSIVDSDYVQITDSLKNLIRSFENNNYNLVSKSRQVGLTTSMRLYSLYKLITEPNYKILYVITII